jgi:methylmalonyl-CoA mutase C-terminal domain/subunit
MSLKKPIRVLIAKPGLDGHDKGAKILVKGLKDAGMEVIYTGIRQAVDSILKAAIQENVDVIGLSILSGSHMEICQELMDKMKKQRLEDIMVLAGGFIPKKDVNRLKELGVTEVFRPSSKITDIAQFIQTKIPREEREGD